MSSKEIPLSPITRDEIHKLETTLLIMTLFRPDVIEALKNPEERVTWVDSLAVAASALARQKSGMPVSKIAEELGRSEHSIQQHLQGKTKAGQLIQESYKQLVSSGGKFEISLPGVSSTETLKERLTPILNKLDEVIKLLNEVSSEVKKLLGTQP